jgi:hypothetical protein
MSSGSVAKVSNKSQLLSSGCAYLTTATLRRVRGEEKLNLFATQRD